MATKTWPQGLGGSTGDQLATEAPLTVSGNVWYVDSQTGSVSGPGTNEDAPYATIAQAIAVAAAHDIIVCLSGHTEVLTAAIPMALIGLSIVGAGSSAGVPTVSVQMNSSTLSCFTMSAAGTKLLGVKVLSNVQANTGPAVTVTAADCMVRNCYFEQAGTDDGSGVSITSGIAGFRLQDTTFKSTATSVATRPLTGFRVASASTHLYMEGVTVDAGTYGYSAYGINLVAAVTGLNCENLSLLRGANMFVEPTSVGFVNLRTATGGASLVW